MNYTIDDISGAIVFNYHILNVVVSKKKDNLENVIVKVNTYIFSECNLNNEEKTMSMYITTDLSSPNSTTFIPIESITKEMIMNWLNENEGVNKYKELMKSRMLEEYQKNEYVYEIP